MDKKKIMNKLSSIVNKYGNVLFFYIPLITFVASSYFRTFQSIFNFLEIMSTFLLIIGFVINLKTMTKKEFICMTIMGIVAGIIFLISRDKNLIKFFLVIYNASKIKFDECVKVDFIVRLICLISVVFLNAIDIIPSVDITRGEIARYSFGFSHPNSFAYRVLIMIFEFFYLNRFKSYLPNIIITIASSCFLDHYTDSRTVVLLILTTFVFGTLLTNKKISKFVFNNKIIKHLVKNSYFYFSLVILISFLLYKYDTVIGFKINKILSTRLYFIEKYYTEYGIPLFGSNFSNFMSPKNPLDVGYAHFLIRYGIIAFIAIGIGFNKVFNLIFKKKNYSLLIIMFAYLIYGITESSFLRIEQNIFMLIFLLIFKQKEGVFFEEKAK